MLLYTARVLDTIQNQPGSWQSLRVGVFADGKHIGEYIRNYSAFYRTFFPFAQNGKDYALYSPDYTGTRIMELPSCKDIGGEERSGSGFCPVDYFVPTYMELMFDEALRLNNPDEKE